MKIFTCPVDAGCHSPLCKSDNIIFIGAENINEARKYMIEHIEEKCEKNDLKIIKQYGQIICEGDMSREVFYVKEIKRNDKCKDLEGKMKKLNRYHYNNLKN